MGLGTIPYTHFFMPTTQQKPSKFDELVLVYELWNSLKDTAGKIEVVAIYNPDDNRVYTFNHHRANILNLTDVNSKYELEIEEDAIGYPSYISYEEKGFYIVEQCLNRAGCPIILYEAESINKPDVEWDVDWDDGWS